MPLAATTGSRWVFSRVCVVEKVSVMVSRGGVAWLGSRVMAGRVAIEESRGRLVS